jgi:hypothetical protein
MRLTCAAALVAAAVFASGCDESLKDIAGPSPNLTPTFSSIQEEIFENSDSSGRVACITCHTNVGRTPPVGLNLLHGVAYANLVGTPSTQRAGLLRVAPGDPENSYIVHKLEGRSGIVGLRMPRNDGPFLTDGQMDILKRWIELGALDN